MNIVEEAKTPKKKIIKKRKSPSDDDDSSSDSSPPKSSRSNSLSPFRNQFEQQLKLSTTKDSKFRSARRALVDNSEFRLPGREQEVSFIKRDNKTIFNSLNYSSTISLAILMI